MTIHPHDIIELSTRDRFDPERRILSIGGLALTLGIVAYAASLALF